MAWETFKRSAPRTSGRPAVSLSTEGRIGFNSKIACEIIGNKKRFALLLFDRDKKRIGIKLVDNNDDPDVYPVHVSKNGRHASVSGTAFLKHFEIYPSVTRSYTAKYEKDTQTLIVDISPAAATD